MRSNGQSPPSRAQRRKEARASRRLTRGVVRRIDPWSVLKFSVVFYVALYGILLVAAVLLWMAATTTGLRGNVESFVADMIASGQFRFVGWELFRAGAVGGAILVVLGSGTNVMLAVLYNLISDTVGGLMVVVEERPTARSARESVGLAREPATRQSRKRATRSARKRAARPSGEPATRPARKRATRPAREPAARREREPATRSAREPATRPAREPAMAAEPEPVRILIPEAEHRQSHRPGPSPRSEPTGL